MNDELDWNGVRAFAAVAEAGTLTEAARRIGVSQPTLGRAVDALERQLGQTLFVRGRTGMVLTEAGTALLGPARAMEARADALRLLATGRRAVREGTVRVSASRVVAFFLLPPIASEIGQAEPRIALEIEASDAVSDLLRRDADVAVRMVRPSGDDLIATRVGDMPMGAFAAPAYRDRCGLPDGTADAFFRHRLVGYDRSALIVDAMRAGGLDVSRDTFAVRTDDQVVYAALVRAGAGIGFLPAAHPASHALVPVPLPIPAPRLPVWLVAHRDLRTNPAVRFVHDRLRDGLGAALKTRA